MMFKVKALGFKIKAEKLNLTVKMKFKSLKTLNLKL